MYEYIRRTRPQDMTTPTNPSGFDFTNTQVYGLPELFLKQTVIRKKIGDVRRVTEILAVKAWTEQDLGLRLRNLFEQSAMTFFLGKNDFRRVSWDDQLTSPFWVCAERAKRDVDWCLSVHLGEVAVIPSAVLLVDNGGRNSRGIAEVPLPAGQIQVHVVFPLVILLYAAFNIPVPKREAPLWSLLMLPTHLQGHVFSNALELKLKQVPAFECLDLERDAEWCTRQNKDLLGLKQNLRNNIYYRVPGSSEQTRMPWTSDTEEQTVFKELVGYTKYIQSLHAKAGSFDPISAVQEHCASCIRSLEEEEGVITNDIQDLMLHGASVKGGKGLQLKAHFLKMRALVEAL